jgi:hypothetical protein
LLRHSILPGILLQDLPHSRPWPLPAISLPIHYSFCYYWAQLV